MEENNIFEIKHVADLLDMHFHIPSYQRGYRWETKNVEELLDDLYDFSIQMNESNNTRGKFYCIQPLAVVKNINLSTTNETVYDVIDGQQRLTTLFLLLSYLQNTREALYSGSLATSIFSLKYESRDSDFFDNKKFVSCDIKEAISNIDYFYMTRAYIAIKTWFEKTGINKNKILKILIPEDYREISKLEGDAIIKAKEQNDKENDVRFIWYEVPIKEKADSIEVFSQLNYGKTVLTSTELVKALLFQCDIYTEDKNLMREITFRRSCEWDAMEKQLQDPFMWSMLMSSNKYFASHITIVLSLVCNELFEELKEKDNNIKIYQDQDDYIYQVCNQYLGTNKEGDYADNVEKIWDKIQTTFTALYNWYKNPDTYHLIGLLVWLKEFKVRDFNNEKRITLLKDLMTEYRLKSKEDFIAYLKCQIANIIHVEDNLNTKDGIKPWGLERINYHDNSLQLIRILVTFNVEDTRKMKDESARFPFHLLRKYNITSLEHIHPQNLILDNIKLETLNHWLDIKVNSLKQLNKYESYSNDILKLYALIKDENSYKENKDTAQDIINKIDKQFNDLAEMDDKQMHTLYNMALVDKETNSALSNNLLNQKRKILIDYQESKKTYVLPSTQKVFCKYYSPVKDCNSLPELWTQPDREAYFIAIKKVYNEYNSYYQKI